MLVKFIELSLLLILSLFSDLRSYRIDNRIILAFTAIGVLTGLISDGLHGLLSSLAGILLPLLLLFWLYLLRMLGAGDIKLFCAIGAIMGLGFIPWCMAFSFLAGGTIALAAMLIRRSAKQRIKHLGIYLKACFLSGSMLEYTEITDKNDGSKFRFSPAIVLGTAIQAVLSIL